MFTRALACSLAHDFSIHKLIREREMRMRVVTKEKYEEEETCHVVCLLAFFPLEEERKAKKKKI